MSEYISESNLSESKFNKALNLSRLRLLERMGLKIGQDDAPSSSISQRIRQSSITYGEVVGRSPNSYSPGLPEGYAKCDDPIAELYLQTTHLQLLERYYKTNKSPGFLPPELWRFKATTLANMYPEEHQRYLHPLVEGHEWYMGVQVDINENDKALIFSPWMCPSLSGGGSPFPIMYVHGEPDSVSLQRIAYEFGRSRLEDQVEI